MFIKKYMQEYAKGNMSLSMAFHLSDIFAEGYALGFWKSIGINKSKLSRLVTKLMSEHKCYTVMQVANEPDFRQKMYEEYNIPDKGEVEIEGILKDDNRFFDILLRKKAFDYATLGIMSDLSKDEVVKRAKDLGVYDDSMTNCEAKNAAEVSIMKITDLLLKDKRTKYSVLANAFGFSKEDIQERARSLGVYEVSLDN